MAKVNMPPSLRRSKAAPDWLPINEYPGFQAADVADGGIKLAATVASQAMPTMLAADGNEVNMGCLCGLL